jgi:hypothetical protein
MNDRVRVAHECHREDGRYDEKERDLEHKISARFVPKIFTADIKERWLRTAGRAAVITIEREGLKITIGNGNPASTKISASPTIVSFGARFHRLLTFSNEMQSVSDPDSTSHKIPSNPQRPVERAILNRLAHMLRRDVAFVV